ncbi:MAG: putative dehydrogenase [Candidatus Binatia bacterium]|jgi:predicted dehydrogenase
MKNQTRRHFLKTASAASLAFGATPLLAAKTDTQYRTALIGSGWWGMNIMREALSAGRCTAVALADPSADALETSAEEITDLSGDKPKTYKDYREMFAKEKIDIAIVATPDHWHALTTIAALDAGAHVFVEKPTGHTVKESRAMVNAAKRNGKVVQVGLHRRIGPHHVSGMEFLKSGQVGDIGMVRSFVNYGGGAEKPTPNAKIPKGMDWDFYCGPSALRPFNRRIHPGGWRNFMDYGNGTIGDWGVHWLDQVLWWTEEKYPKRVFSTGGRPVRGKAVNDGEAQTTDAPDSQAATFEFEGFTATWENRRFGGAATEKSNVGCYFYGSKGTFHMGWRDGWTFYPSKRGDKEIHADPEFDNQKDGHNLTPLWADFISAIESGKDPVCEIEASHRSSVLPMLANLSMKVGRSVEWDGAKEQIIGDAEANKLLSRKYRGDWVYPEA